MNSTQFQNIKNLLKNLNIFFVESDQIIHTIWKGQDSEDIDIAISYDDDIINAISIINEKKIKEPEFQSIFLKFNLKYPYFKIGLDKKNRYLIIWQYPLSSINEIILKNTFNIFLKFFVSISSNSN